MNVTKHYVESQCTKDQCHFLHGLHLFIVTQIMQRHMLISQRSLTIQHQNVICTLSLVLTACLRDRQKNTQESFHKRTVILCKHACQCAKCLVVHSSTETLKV